MKLIFHIGAGKTGSTSIQRTLKENDDVLKEEGVEYLGLMLERTGNKMYDWQRTSSVVVDFHHLKEDVATEQLLNVFKPIIAEAKLKNIHTLIWSNESFLGGKHNFLPALQTLQQEGMEVEILVYVREYASWSRSAYVQWGIKHKTYSGKLQTYKEWIQRHSPAFYNQMKNLLNTVPDMVHVRNMSAVDDVVIDFLNYADIDKSRIKVFRDNDSPRSEELLLRAVFNSKYDAEVLPARFNNVLGNKISFVETPKHYLESLLPKKEDFDNVLKSSANDLELLNKLLEEQGQQVLSGDTVNVKDVNIDDDKLLMTLIDIVMQQSRRIDRLENDIKENKV